MTKKDLKRGDIIDVDLFGATRTEKKNDRVVKYRPCVVVQNDIGNAHSPLTIVAPLTDARQFKSLPVQVLVNLSDGVTKQSVVECGHLRSIDRDKRVVKIRGELSAEAMTRVDAALKISLSLP